MPEHELTPEDRLLKIIESPTSPKPSSGAESPQAALLKTESSGKAFSFRFSRIPFSVVNGVMLGVCVLMTIAAVVVFKNAQTFFDKKFEKVISAVDSKEEIEKESLGEEDMTQVLSIARQHNIYTLDHPETSVEGLMTGDSQETANLKLVGIMWSEKPQAMIEDIIEHKTFLLNVGEKAGRLTVKGIEKDKVILGRDDHIWELR